MQHSDQPFVELKKAEEAISAMESSKTLDQFEEQWKEFLRRIERCWNKAQAHFGKSPKWNGWQGKIEKLRKNDDLLLYLVQARGAEEHSVNEISEHQPGSIGINPAVGNSLFIEKLEIRNGQIVELRSPQLLRIDVLPARIRLLPVVNRGRRYEIPQHHLGGSIDPMNVISISKAAYIFYEKILTEAEKKFVG